MIRRTTPDDLEAIDTITADGLPFLTAIRG
jgi:hypothetical protein